MRFWKTLSALCVLTLVAVSCSKAEHEIQPSNPSLEYTLAIIKPNAVKNNDIGGILTRLESGGLRIAALKMQKLTLEEAKQFYTVHRDRSFFPQLTTFMSSGPIVAVALEGENAVARSRAIMGETDPTKAQPGTIRSDYGVNVTENGIHGSDSAENARKELSFFFSAKDLQQRY